jgi:hypothetical protein
VSTSITEVPYFLPREYPTADDPTKGYLLVVVPQSSRAPHQVIVGGQYRFYGRSGKANRILNEGDVARLYQRRNEWAQDRDRLLGEALTQAPLPPHSHLVYIHGFVRPVAPDRAIWDRAQDAAGSRGELQQAIMQAVTAARPQQGYSPDLRSGTRWARQGADEWRVSSSYVTDYSDPNQAERIVDVRINVDGRAHLFGGRAGARTRPQYEGQPGRLFIFEAAVAGNLAAMLAATGTLYRLGGYYGHVDVGVALTGARGAYSGTLLDRQVGFYEESMTYNSDGYFRHERVAAARLHDPRDLVRQLLRHLFEATTMREDYDPFTA